MIKQGKVVSVGFDVEVKKSAGGTYPAWQLIYTVDGKVESLQKHMKGLGFSPGLRESLASLVAGDDVTVQLEKKGDFWEVEKITKGHSGTPSVAGSTATTKVAGSNYETKDERAARQRLIVRQSSLTAALSFYSNFMPKSKEGHHVNDIKELADDFTNFVFETNKEPEVM